MKKIYIFKHNPNHNPNAPLSPFLWPWDVCLELLYLQPPLWKNPGSAPGTGLKLQEIRLLNKCSKIGVILNVD